MGNNSSNPVRNLDKRTARRLHRHDFMRGIDDFRYEFCHNDSNDFDDGNYYDED